MEQVFLLVAEFRWYGRCNRLVDIKNLYFQSRRASNVQGTYSPDLKIVSYQRETRLRINASFYSGEAAQLVQGSKRTERIFNYDIEQRDKHPVDDSAHCQVLWPVMTKCKSIDSVLGVDRLVINFQVAKLIRGVVPIAAGGQDHIHQSVVF